MDQVDASEHLSADHLSADHLSADHLSADHLSAEQLHAGASSVLASPSELGTVEMIVRRPAVDEREVIEQGRLLPGLGLEGDNYLSRGNSKTPDGTSHPEAELTIMNSAAIDLVANGNRDRWSQAGDQLLVDFDLSRSNLPTGSRLSIGTAVIEVTAKPHTGCAKFARRFGVDAARWVNSSEEQRFRGINAVVVEPGIVKTGDPIVKA